MKPQGFPEEFIEILILLMKEDEDGQEKLCRFVEGLLEIDHSFLMWVIEISKILENEETDKQINLT